ncbi:hypothetical protein F4776DRAFT_663199 [Hypoxylon sp. NC0597]|nr:hypothetical protein F4776DRAFT_663199 [Hypoxylon sp. NC0597]
MAPLPENPDGHYDAAVPLDGGVSPADLGGGSKHNSPTGLEIGVITGVVVLVIISVVGLFVWRSRKNSNAKVMDAASATDAAGTVKEGSDQTVGVCGIDNTSRRSKNDPTATVKNDDMSSLEHPAIPERVPDRLVDYYPRAAPKAHGRDQAVEEHEIVNRA